MPRVMYRNCAIVAHFVYLYYSDFRRLLASSRLLRQALDCNVSRPIIVVAPAASGAPLLADSAFGMLIFAATEVMFCTALISAFVIIKAGIEPWTPPVGVLLPVVGTVLSPVLLLLARSAPARSRPLVRHREQYHTGSDPARAAPQYWACVLFSSGV